VTRRLTTSDPCNISLFPELLVDMSFFFWDSSNMEFLYDIEFPIE